MALPAGVARRASQLKPMTLAFVVSGLLSLRLLICSQGAVKGHTEVGGPGSPKCLNFLVTSLGAFIVK